VAQIVDWVFSDCDGVLPFDVYDMHGQRRKDSERKVTSVRKVLENYDELWSAWSLGKTSHTREVNYRLPLDDEQEQAVQDLIEAFEDFWVTCFAHGQEVHPAQRDSWAKDFRKLVTNDKADAAELLEVIGGLKKYRSGMEHQRYFEPRYLHRDAVEWDLVRHRLKLCRLEEKLEAEAQAMQEKRRRPTRFRDTADDERECAIDAPIRPAEPEAPSWDDEPWGVRRERIAAERPQIAAVASERPQPTNHRTRQILALLEASRAPRTA
jgi:hypothetical protein